jgi:RNA polymerase sigma-70 factor (ECF subfamily)
LRRRRPAISLQDVDAECRSHGPVQAAVFNELTVALRDAIARLPDQQAEVFCLKYFDGLSNAEIATSLETSTGAIATSLHKARQALAAVFNEDLEEQAL